MAEGIGSTPDAGAEAREALSGVVQHGKETAGSVAEAARQAVHVGADAARTAGAQAAELRKDTDIDRIYSALAVMRDHCDDKRVNEDADRLFHLRIAEATGNAVLAHMVSALWGQRRGPHHPSVATVIRACAGGDNGTA